MSGTVSRLPGFLAIRSRYSLGARAAFPYRSRVVPRQPAPKCYGSKVTESFAFSRRTQVQLGAIAVSAPRRGAIGRPFAGHRPEIRRTRRPASIRFSPPPFRRWGVPCRGSNRAPERLWGTRAAIGAVAALVLARYSRIERIRQRVPKIELLRQR